MLSDLVFGLIPDPHRAVRPVLDYLPVQEELELERIALGILCLRRPGYSGSYHLRALFVCGKGFQNRSVISRKDDLEGGALGAVPFDIVLSVSCSDPDDVLTYLIFGRIPDPHRSVRPVLHYLSVQGELELQWVIFCIRSNGCPGYYFTCHLGTRLVSGKIAQDGSSVRVRRDLETGALAAVPFEIVLAISYLGLDDVLTYLIFRRGPNPN
jgi:hypothetical protein